MEPTPRECGEQCQFDYYCKLVLKHEAIDYLRELRYRRDNETVFSALPQAEMDKPCSVDRYPSDSYVFSSYGCDLPIENELVAEAFASLSASDQSILILRCVMNLTDKEIGSVMGLCRSAVQKRRTRTIEALRTKLAALMPGGGKV